jgi:hypothetical protein
MDLIRKTISNNLKHSHMYTTREKLIATLLHKQGLSIRSISRIRQVPKSTIGDWVIRYKNSIAVDKVDDHHMSHSSLRPYIDHKEKQKGRENKSAQMREYLAWVYARAASQKPMECKNCIYMKSFRSNHGDLRLHDFMVNNSESVNALDGSIYRKLSEIELFLTHKKLTFLSYKLKRFIISNLQ